MDLKQINKELVKIQQASFAKKTDNQLQAYEELHQLYKNLNKGVQPAPLAKYNNPINRNCKLTHKKVMEIRDKYIPYVYGKQRLAKEYGVSTSVIYRIVKGKSWKTV